MNVSNHHYAGNCYWWFVLSRKMCVCVELIPSLHIFRRKNVSFIWNWESSFSSRFGSYLGERSWLSFWKWMISHKKKRASFSGGKLIISPPYFHGSLERERIGERKKTRLIFLLYLWFSYHLFFLKLLLLSSSIFLSSSSSLSIDENLCQKRRDKRNRYDDWFPTASRYPPISQAASVSDFVLVFFFLFFYFS